MRITRREFVATSACGAASLALRRFAWATETKERLPLAFSTLGCPSWEWPKILEFAESHGFAAIELRGLMGSMDLPARPEFAPERIAQSKKEIAAHGLKIANIGSSSALHDADPSKHAQQLADAKRFIDLASALGSPCVRVFGNEIKGRKEEVVARVAAGLHELGEYAGPRGVTVIIESHGDFADSPTLKEVLTRRFTACRAALGCAPHLRRWPRAAGVHGSRTGLMDSPHALEGLRAGWQGAQICAHGPGRRAHSAASPGAPENRLPGLLLLRVGEGLASGLGGPGNRLRGLRQGRRGLLLVNAGQGPVLVPFQLFGPNDGPSI